MHFLARLMTVFIAATAFCDASAAQSRRTLNAPPAPSEQQIRERLNAGTVGLAGGLLEGAPIRFATEIARVVNESNQVHVLPIVTRGPTENVNDLLYLKGVDLAIINTDSLEEYKMQVPQIQQRIVSIINLFPSDLHIFVRPEIQSLADLAGKKVNFNTQGTAAAYSGPLIFSRLGIAADKMFVPHPVAMEQLRRGEIAAVVFITSKPVDAFVKGKWDAGFKFLPVEFGPKFSDYYVASTLEFDGLSQPDREGRARRHHRGSHRSRIVQLAAGDAALSPGRTLRGRILQSDRQIEVARIRSEMERDRPEDGCAGHRTVPGCPKLD